LDECLLVYLRRHIPPKKTTARTINKRVPISIPALGPQRV
jgi:hypothetical protein